MKMEAAGSSETLVNLYQNIRRQISKYSTVELHLSGLTGMACHPDMQKILIIGFFFENRLHWQFEVRLLLSTVCTYLGLNPVTTPDLQFWNP